LGQQTNIYASYSKGFKGGTFPYSAFGTVPINPESVDGFEAGIKSNVSRAFSVALSGFYQKYKDIQVEVLSPNPVSPLSFLTVLTNAGKGTISGFDLDVTVRPVRDLSLAVRAEYLNTRYGDFPNANVQFPRPLASCPPAALPAGCGRIGRPTDVSGNDIKHAPAWTGSAMLDYIIHPSIGDLAFSANAYLTSSYYLDVGNLYKQPGYILLGGKLSWTPSNSPTVTLSVWGKNLTNEAYNSGYNESNGGILWAVGRTVGVEASVKF
jgi:iron complex outermembrane receptor protein